MRLVANFVLNHKLSKVVVYPIYTDHFKGLRLKGHTKGNGKHIIKLGEKPS